jgi:hypothetical protein
MAMVGGLAIGGPPPFPGALVVVILGRGRSRRWRAAVASIMAMQQGEQAREKAMASAGRG